MYFVFEAFDASRETLPCCGGRRAFGSNSLRGNAGAGDQLVCLLGVVGAGDDAGGFRGRVGRGGTLGLSLVRLGMVLFATGFAGLMST